MYVKKSAFFIGFCIIKNRKKIPTKVDIFIKLVECKNGIPRLKRLNLKSWFKEKICKGAAIIVIINGAEKCKEKHIGETIIIEIKLVRANMT